MLRPSWPEFLFLTFLVLADIFAAFFALSFCDLYLVPDSSDF